MKSNNSSISHVGAKKSFLLRKIPCSVISAKKSRMPSKRIRVPIYVPSLSVAVVVSERESVSIEFGMFIDK